MTVLEIIAVAVSALTGLAGLFIAFGRYFLGRLREQDASTKARIKELEDEVRRLKVEADKVPELMRQVAILTNTLENTERRLDEAERRADTNAAKAKEHLEQIEERDKKIRALERKCGEQQTIIAAYERALELLGTRLTTEARAGADQPPETNEQPEHRASGEGAEVDGSGT